MGPSFSARTDLFGREYQQPLRGRHHPDDQNHRTTLLGGQPTVRYKLTSNLRPLAKPLNGPRGRLDATTVHGQERTDTRHSKVEHILDVEDTVELTYHADQTDILAMWDPADIEPEDASVMDESVFTFVY